MVSIAALLVKLISFTQLGYVTFSLFTLVCCYSKAVKYPVALVPTEEGFSVSCPGLPGCWSQGETEEEALENIRDAIQEYLAAKEIAY